MNIYRIYLHIFNIIKYTCIYTQLIKHILHVNVIFINVCLIFIVSISILCINYNIPMIIFFYLCIPNKIGWSCKFNNLCIYLKECILSLLIYFPIYIIPQNTYFYNCSVIKCPQFSLKFLLNKNQCYEHTAYQFLPHCILHFSNKKQHSYHSSSCFVWMLFLSFSFTLIYFEFV